MSSEEERAQPRKCVGVGVAGLERGYSSASSCSSSSAPDSAAVVSHPIHLAPEHPPPMRKRRVGTRRAETRVSSSPSCPSLPPRSCAHISTFPAPTTDARRRVRSSTARSSHVVVPIYLSIPPISNPSPLPPMARPTSFASHTRRRSCARSPRPGTPSASHNPTRLGVSIQSTQERGCRRPHLVLPLAPAPAAAAAPTAPSSETPSSHSQPSSAYAVISALFVHISLAVLTISTSVRRAHGNGRKNRGSGDARVVVAASGHADAQNVDATGGHAAQAGKDIDRGGRMSGEGR
ncbi:hypothetical protein C8R46DRAFT_1236097 [Mycena filopes]|nr:hypothetical protein C8R46DRAFT_1236097 [Mycena filopes]